MKSKNRGFTLIEVVAAVAIFAIAMTGISTGLNMVISQTANNATKLKCMSFANFAIESFKNNEPQNVKKVYINTPNQTMYFNNEDELARLVSEAKNSLTESNDKDTSKYIGTINIEKEDNSKRMLEHFDIFYIKVQAYERKHPNNKIIREIYIPVGN